jgi:hypothetical protein
MEEEPSEYVNFRPRFRWRLVQKNINAVMSNHLRAGLLSSGNKKNKVLIEDHHGARGALSNQSAVR